MLKNIISQFVMLSAIVKPISYLRSKRFCRKSTCICWNLLQCRNGAFETWGGGYWLFDFRTRHWRLFKTYLSLQPTKYLVILQVPKWAGPDLLCQKRWFAFSKISFCADRKVFEEALNAVKFLDWLKKFGPAQNILGPVKGQGIRSLLGTKDG